MKLLKLRAGRVDERTATTLNNLAAVYFSEGLYDRAERLYIKAFDLYRKNLPEDHPYLIVVRNNLAVLYLDKGDLERAASFSSSSGELESWPLRALQLNNRAAIEAGKTNYDAASSLLARAVALHEGNGDRQSAAYASILNNIGAVQFRQGLYELAEQSYLKALSLRLERLASGHPDVGQSYYNLAKLTIRLGRLEEASAYLAKSLHIRLACFGSDHQKVRDCKDLERSLRTMLALR
ncbi:MAG: tetratricopeptide repeat protein [Cyanobacteria bacterium HKST-UBA02]|nr:tetratricopeptide repeat protein [Cyanobacteria bacterium HKST-UBA02]